MFMACYFIEGISPCCKEERREMKMESEFGERYIADKQQRIKILSILHMII
jgi:hypothetical protein